jgi:hypothetical protein
VREVLILVVTLAGCSSSPSQGLPAELRDTGMDDSRNREYQPAFEAWSDGADKTRWIQLPSGTAVDASDPNAWIFPVGTKLWKEFRVGGRKIETRMLWKDAPSHWTMAAYVWSADQTTATIATEPVQPIPGSTYEVPAGQCEQCHQAIEKPIGYSTLMLTDTPLAAASAVERDAIGYLHANCGVSCHRPDGSAPFSMRIDVAPDGHAPATADETAVWSAINHPSRFTPPGGSGVYYRLRPMDASRSTILYRMSTRAPGEGMPPVGSHVVDDDGRAKLAAWIDALR